MLYYTWWKQIKVCRKFWTRNWYLRTELKGRVLKFYKLVKGMQIYIYLLRWNLNLFFFNRFLIFFHLEHALACFVIWIQVENFAIIITLLCNQIQDVEVKKKSRVTLNCSIFITSLFHPQLCEIRLLLVKYKRNRNGILIRKSMFIAQIMGLLTKEKNTTKNILWSSVNEKRVFVLTPSGVFIYH